MRGRNKELIKKRNRKLLERWIYWTEQRRLRFDDTLKILSEEEFFLSEARIVKVLRRQGYELQQEGKQTHKPCRNPLRKAIELDLFNNNIR